MKNIEAQFAALKPKQHEVAWSRCEQCKQEVPSCTLDQIKLKVGTHICRLCAYGPSLAQLARHTNMVAIHAEVLRYRYNAYQMRGGHLSASTHASRTAVDN